MVAILFSGCQSEVEEEIHLDNYFKFDGETYVIKGSWVLDQSNDQGVKDAISFSFFDEDFKIEMVDNEPVPLNSSKLEGLSIVTLTNGWSYDGELQSGEYQITSYSDFVCFIGINYSLEDEFTSIDDGEFRQEYEITNGTVIIEVGNGSYSFKINGTTMGGNVLELIYEDKPDYYHIVNRE